MIGLVKRKEWALVANPGWRIPLPLDSLHRTTLGQIEDRASWRYGYDDRDQLTDGKRYWSDSQAVARQQFEYAYDNIGNRIISKSGGDERGAGLRPASYSVNDANEYVAITNAAYKDIIGVALNDNSVTINGGSADRKTEYFHREITVTNASGSCWTPVTASVASSSSNWSTSGGLVLPGQSQTLSYDASGNLTFDGIWQYRWDSENRLTEMVMTNVANIPSVQRKKLEFAYDYQGRRISKKVSQWDTNSSSFIAATNNLFVYDGWNLLAVLDSDLRPLTSFIWGLDLSGSDLGAIGQGAGGVGGLLLESGSASPQFACYDGNGNVTALVATDGNVSARYEYSPCGDILRATGPMAAENSVRWSSKMWDPETDLVYYGFRYYSARLGRFLSRDPLQEPGSLSAYALCGNNPLLRFDPDGRFWKEFTQIITATAAGAAAGAGVGYMSSGLNPAGAAAGGWAGGINGFMAGLSGIVYGQSWGTILGNAAANGALSGLPGGLGTIKPQWGALGGFVAGVGNAALSGADSAGSYAFAAAMGAVFGYAGGEAAAMDSPAMDAVLSAASESGATAALGLWNFFEEALK